MIGGTITNLLEGNISQFRNPYCLRSCLLILKFHFLSHSKFYITYITFQNFTFFLFWILNTCSFLARLLIGRLLIVFGRPVKTITFCHLVDLSKQIHFVNWKRSQSLLNYSEFKQQRSTPIQWPFQIGIYIPKCNRIHKMFWQSILAVKLFRLFGLVDGGRGKRLSSGADLLPCRVSWSPSPFSLCCSLFSSFGSSIDSILSLFNTTIFSFNTGIWFPTVTPVARLYDNNASDSCVLITH